MKEQAVKVPRSGSRLIASLWRDRYLYLLLVPVITYYIIFKYIPMYGLVIAFKDFSIFKGIFNSPWVGLKHFNNFFQSRDFVIILKNTLVLNLYSLIFGFPGPIILALMLNEVKHLFFKKTIQTIVYLPHFISWIVIGGIITNLLSPSSGFINQIIKWVTGGKSIFFLTNPSWWRFVYIFSGIWKEIGWGAIIYLASLMSIDPELYEAAMIDGANKWKQIWHISIPGISTTIAILFILRLGNLLDIGFEHVFVLYNPLVYNVSDVISTYVYRKGLQEAKYSFTTAVGLFQSVIGFILVMTANKLSKKYSEAGIW
jgi:putative aldouronate transport system permease protein